MATHMSVRMRNSIIALQTLCDVSGSQKSNVATTKPEIPHFSASRWDIIEIATAIPMFWRMRNSNIAIQTLCDVSGCKKSEMAAAKPVIPQISARTWNVSTNTLNNPIYNSRGARDERSRELICNVSSMANVTLFYTTEDRHSTHASSESPPPSIIHSAKCWKNIGFSMLLAVVLSSPSCLQADISVPPLLCPPSWISHFRLNTRVLWSPIRILDPWNIDV